MTEQLGGEPTRELGLTCGACGTPSPAGFSFCGRCGAALQDGSKQQSLGEERRIISVLFVDLVGFTSRSESLDPEDVRAILMPYYATVRKQIESFGGTVEKFIGDAVMGVFGAPVAQGDDPERAVRAALGILGEIATISPAHPRPDLAVRIAVNTGEAIVALGARTDEGEAMVAGDVVNTAARLQTAAATNSILVSEETYWCTCSTIDYEPVQSLALKGKELPVPAWRVLGASRPPGERMAPDVPIVGREQELSTLTGVWKRVLADRRPELVTISGLPGVGKSRLAAEFMTMLGETGARVIRGRSLPYGESGAYDAFAQQVKQVADVFDGDPPAVALRKLRQTIEGLVPGDCTAEVTAHMAMMLGLPTDERTTVAAVNDRQILFTSATRFVEALGSAGPTVLVFQDLHWADSSLLDLIESLSARVARAPLLFLALARSELQAKRPRWFADVENLVALPLEPLHAEHSRELAARLLARASTDDLTETAEEIGEVAEGNPLFIEELVAGVAERSAPAGAELPTNIRGIIVARLDAIPSRERSLLLNASVIGRIFWSGALAAVAGPEARLAELLDALEGRDLIRPEPVSRFRGQQQFRFKHALIRDVAYATLPRATRREAHGSVARFLEQVHAEHDSPAALGHHWVEAGDRERAADYFVAAAEQASRGWAKDEAVALYRQALGLVREEDRERRGKLRLKLALAEQMLYHLPDAQRIARGQHEAGPER